MYNMSPPDVAGSGVESKFDLIAGKMKFKSLEVQLLLSMDVVFYFA